MLMDRGMIRGIAVAAGLAVAAPLAAVAPADTATRLAELDRLLAQGAITKDEHAAKRAEILRSL